MKEEELRALAKVASGKDVVDIAREEGLTVNAVAARLDRAVRELDAENLLEAVSKAARLGLIRVVSDRPSKAPEADG